MAAAIWKNKKNNISQTVRPILMKFGTSGILVLRSP